MFMGQYLKGTNMAPIKSIMVATILDINYLHFYNFYGISHHKRSWRKFLYTLEAKTSSVKIFVGENFHRQKFSSLAQNFVTFYRRKF